MDQPGTSLHVRMACDWLDVYGYLSSIYQDQDYDLATPESINSCDFL